MLWKEKRAITPLGQEVILSREIWEKHILVGHADLKNQETAVLETLEQLDFLAFNPKYCTYNAVAETILVAYARISSTQGLAKTRMKITKNYKTRLRKYMVWTPS